MFKYQISRKSVQWKPFHADGHRLDKLTVAFRNFANAPSK